MNESTEIRGVEPPTPRLELRILDRATEVLRQGWTRGAYSRNQGGFGTQVEDPQACCYCLVGAILKAQKELEPGGYAAFDACHVALDAWVEAHHEIPVGKSHVPYFNDHIATCVEDVLAVIQAVRPQFETESTP